MNLDKGVLKSFDPGSYTATVQLSGSYKAYLEGVNVARNIAAAELTPGRKVALVFFDDSNLREALVTAVYE